MGNSCGMLYTENAKSLYKCAIVLWQEDHKIKMPKEGMWLERRGQRAEKAVMGQEEREPALWKLIGSVRELGLCPKGNKLLESFKLGKPGTSSS